MCVCACPCGYCGEPPVPVNVDYQPYFPSAESNLIITMSPGFFPVITDLLKEKKK